VTITPAEFNTELAPALGVILGVEPNYILDRVRRGTIYNRFAPIKIKRDIDFQTLSTLEELRDRFPGVDYQIETKRFFPTGAKAVHLFGYTKEISERQLAELPEYAPGDIIGASGLEAAYERDLRGQKGYEFILVNAKGQIVGSYNDGRSDVRMREGNDLYLALDADLQAFAESLLTDRQGAVVALDPSDGGILAIVSKPDYDLSLLSGFTPANVWNALNNDPAKPLFNRATMTRYPPGSTFKMVVAAAGLQEGVITPNWGVNCTGAFRLGTKVFKDLHVHGSTQLVESIQRSCNVYYYNLVLKIGLERFTRFGQMFGFGSKTGIDIGEEDTGLMPSQDYFNRVYGRGRWTQGYIVSLGIGQGEVGVSPLQMAAYAMALANKGTYYQPHVVRSIKDKESGSQRQIPFAQRNIELSPAVWSAIRLGLERCVNAEGGTGGMARVKGVTVAGKTGTAENPHGKDHAWFVGYAPAEDPKIAICVLVETAGYGGVVSAPIAGMCIEKYLYRQLIRNKKEAVIVAAPPDSTAND
jgi:penicillin-binding protein 2